MDTVLFRSDVLRAMPHRTGNYLQSRATLAVDYKTPVLASLQDQMKERLPQLCQRWATQIHPKP